METVFHYTMIAVMAVLAVFLMFSLIRTIRGPRRADRIMGVNMIGSLTTGMLASLAVYLHESWLLDVCLVYCLISFLAVMILSKIHINEGADDKDSEEVSLYE